MAANASRNNLTQPPPITRVGAGGGGGKAAPQLSLQDVNILAIARKTLNNRTGDKFKDSDLNELIGQVMQINIKIPNLKKLLYDNIELAQAKSIMEVIEPRIKEIRSHQKQELATMMVCIIAGIAIMVLGIIATSTGYGAFVGIPFIAMGLLFALYTGKPVFLPIAKTAFLGIKALYSKVTHLKLWKKLKRKKRLAQRSTLPNPIQVNAQNLPLSSATQQAAPSKQNPPLLSTPPGLNPPPMLSTSNSTS